MQTIIVGHHSRIDWISQLQQAIPGAAAVVDNVGEGALQGHIKALKIAREIGERCIIMEDDAIPVVGFDNLARSWADKFPDDLVSFYLGTGRPAAWQTRVDYALEHNESDHIILPRLIHGVCYSIPANHVGRTLDRIHAMGDTDEAADYVVGRGFGRQVVYLVESLVEHRDGISVECHPDGEPRTERRVARNLAGKLMYER